MSVIPDYDTLWKEIIAELFEEFLLYFAPDLYEQVDFSKKYDFLEQELHQLFPASETGKKYTDKLAKVYLENGEEQWILIHIEIQGTYKKDFAKRMFQYFYRVLDKYDRQIYAISLFTDTSPTFQPNRYEYQFYGTSLTYTYNTYKLAEQQEEALLISDNPFALVILAGLYVIKAKQEEQQKYAFKKRLLRLLLEKEWARDNIRNLFVFIDAIIQLPDQESIQLLEEIKPYIEKEEIIMALSLDSTSFARIYRQEGKEEGIKEGIRKGMKEGIEEGRKAKELEVAKKMLLEGLSKELVVKITTLSMEEVERIQRELNN